MKRFSITILFFAFIHHMNAQTVIGGVFFRDTTLAVKNSPYHVTSNVLVPMGIRVNVEPGVIFYFDSNISWTVEGEFQAIGNRTDSIKFLSYSGGRWGDIIYNKSAAPYNPTNKTGCVLDYCVISHTSSIWINSTTVYILHSEVKNAASGIIAYGSGDVIKHSHIHDCTSALSTFYGFLFVDPVVMDSCEINNINGSSDIIRLTANVIFSNNCVHDIHSDFAVSVFEGPNIEVTNNNFYNNNAAAIVLINGSDASVKISNNNFANNTTNISKSECYSVPLITGNNFYSYKNYNIYCTSTFAMSGPICRSIPNSSFYTLDMKQNYFARKSVADLDNSIYDLHDDWTGRTTIAYDATIKSPYLNKNGCAFDTALSVSDHSPVEHSLSIYPNPFNEKLSISTDETGSFEFILYDLLSRKCLQQIFTSSLTIGTEVLSAGVYIYEVRNKNGVVQNGKVVKDRFK